MIKETDSLIDLMQNRRLNRKLLHNNSIFILKFYYPIEGLIFSQYRTDDNLLVYLYTIILVVYMYTIIVVI